MGQWGESTLFFPTPHLYLCAPFPSPISNLMANPRPLTQREQDLIQLYSHCQLRMTPKQFYAKWQVTYELIAVICSRSLFTVSCWFSRGRSYRRPTANDLRHLALMDFLLEHFEEVSEELLNLLCHPSQNQ